jgi:3',5'-cyclic AMP phosphodiesterase CpdA
MSEPTCDLLVIADVHYMHTAADVDAERPERQGRRGLELLRRAGAAAGAVDAIALMGDLVNDGEQPSTPDALAAIRATLDEAAPDVPLLVVPGNHDGDADALLAAFDCPPGVRALGGYRFVTFVDTYAADGKTCTRPVAEFGRLAHLPPGGPVVAVQHNPIWPDIASDYPFMPTNVEAIRASYADAGVMLSISGHYHTGQSLMTHDGVRYFVAPTISEDPFRFAVVRLRGEEVGVEMKALGF